MKGLEYVAQELGRVRFRLSRLIELERVPADLGNILLWKVVEVADLAQEGVRKEHNIGSDSGRSSEEAVRV